MNTHTINNISSIGNTLQNAGTNMASTVINAYQRQKQENEAMQNQIRDNQVSEVVRLFETYTMGEGGIFQSKTIDIPEGKLANFDAYADSEVWDHAIDNINAITGGRFDQAVIDKALEKINVESKAKYSMMKERYKNTSMVTAIQSSFLDNEALLLSATNDDGSYVYDNADGSESAKSYMKAYDNYANGSVDDDGNETAGYTNFGIINKEGAFDAKGEVGREAIAKVAFSNHISSLVETNAKKGDLYTQQMIMDEVESWGRDFCAELGMTKEQTEAWITEQKNKATSQLVTMKNNLSINASESMKRAEAMFADTMKSNGYRSMAEIPIDDRLQMMSDAGLGDWNDNSYSYDCAKQLVDKMYQADMQLNRKDLMQGLELYDKGELEGVNWSIDDLTKVVISGNYAWRDVTTYTVSLNDENFETSEEFSSEMNLAIKELNRIYNNSFDDLAESETGIAPSISTMFGKEIDEICDALGVTDAYGKYTVAMHVENMIQSNLSKDGRYGQVNVQLDSMLKNDAVDPEVFRNVVTTYAGMGYINEAQAQSYIEEKSFTTYKAEYEKIMKDLRTRVPDDGGYIFNSPATRKYIRDAVMKANGVIDEPLISEIAGVLNRQYADEVTLDALTSSIKAVADPDAYVKGTLESMSAGWNVSRIMGDYANGSYASLGIDALVGDLRKTVESTVGSTRTELIDSTHAEYLCETAWKKLGYAGSYKDSKKDDVRREIVEKASMISLAFYAQEKNMQSQIGNTFGNGSVSTMFSEGSFGGVARVSLTGEIAYQIMENGEPKYVVGRLKEDYRQKVLNGTVSVQPYMIEEYMGGDVVTIIKSTPYKDGELQQLNEGLAVLGYKNYRYVVNGNGKLGIEKYDPMSNTWYNVDGNRDVPKTMLYTQSKQDALHLDQTGKLQNMSEFRQFVAQSLPWNKQENK